MNGRFGATALLAGCALALTGCSGSVNASDGPAPAGSLDTVSGTLTVQADSSLRDLLDGAAAALQRDHPKVHVDVAASSRSSPQAADVVVSTSRQQLERLHSAGAVGQSSVVGRQVLTIAVAPGNPGHVATLADLRRPGVSVALCSATEPCGETAATLLGRADVTPSDVRRVADTQQGLAAVAAGRVDAALVWASDLRGRSGAGSVRRGVRTTSLAAGQQENIRLTGLAGRPVLAATAQSGNRPAADAFLDLLHSGQGQQLLRTEGFR